MKHKANVKGEKIIIRHTGSHYYIVVEYLDRYYTQAHNLKIDIEEYKEKLLKEFNGVCFLTEIYFAKEDDAKAAADWIESLLIMRELMGNE